MIFFPDLSIRTGRGYRGTINQSIRHIIIDEAINKMVNFVLLLVRAIWLELSRFPFCFVIYFSSVALSSNMGQTSWNSTWATNAEKIK